MEVIVMMLKLMAIWNAKYAHEQGCPWVRQHEANQETDTLGSEDHLGFAKLATDTMLHFRIS